MPEKSYPEGDLLDIKQSAKHLDVSTKTIRRYIKAGKLSARKVRNVWFVPKTEVEALKKGESSAGAEPEEQPAQAEQEIQEQPRPQQQQQDTGLPDFIRKIDTNLETLKQQVGELDRRLYLFSQEREAGRISGEGNTTELESRNQQLEAENERLEEQAAALRDEIDRLKKNGPKDTMVLKQKSEEIEALKATIASNQRGLSILREEVGQYQNEIQEKDTIIEQLRARIASLEKEITDLRNSRKLSIWGNRR